MSLSMTFKPRFITVDDFDNYFAPHKLVEMMRNNSMGQAGAERFLFRVENELMAWIDKKTARNIPFEALKGFQLEQFQLALLYQAYYCWENGQLGMDSGYDQERGFIADNAILGNISVPSTVIDFLSRAGLYTQKLKPRKRYLAVGFNDYLGSSSNPNGTYPTENHIIGQKK